MSRFIQPLPFSPHYDFVAARVVTINGQNLVPGDPVNKADLGERRLRQMYESRIITPVAPTELPVAPKKQGKKKAAEAQQEPVEADAEPEAIDTPEVSAEATSDAPAPAVAAAGNTIDHRGFGRYFVLDAAGNEIAGPLSKAAATALLEA